MMKHLYTVSGKNRPYITDKGTKFEDIVKCPICGPANADIKELAAYLPNSSKIFGLIWQTGIIGPQNSVDFLRDHGINQFTTEYAKVKFGRNCKNSIDSKFFWIKPTAILELDTDNGPGPVVVCEICGRKTWREKNLLLPRFKEKVESDFFLIKDTWAVIVSEKFIKVAKKVPYGCYLEFEPWYYEEKDN